MVDDHNPNALPLPEEEENDQKETVRSPSGDAEIVEPDERFAKDVSEQLFGMTSSLWQGRLPPPDALKEFDVVVEGLAREIANDMLEDGKRFDRAAAMDHEISTRVVTVMEKESASDITFRTHVFDRLLPLFYLPLIVIVLIVFAPLADWVKAVIIPAVLVTSAAPICISLLRGRMTKSEADVIKSVIPQVVEAVKTATATTSAAPPDSPSKNTPLPGDETKKLSDTTENPRP